MSKITQEQKNKVLELYNQRLRSMAIAKEIGISRRVVQDALYSFDAGDSSWVNCSFRHYSKMFSESEKENIAIEFTDIFAY